MIRRYGPDAAGVLVQALAGRTARVQARRDALQEAAGVRGGGTHQGAALVVYAVPGAVGILQGHALACWAQELIVGGLALVVVDNFFVSYRIAEDVLI